LLALCALTAIRLAIEEKLEWAVAAIVFAALPMASMVVSPAA
jgi:hypothetical protein